MVSSFVLFVCGCLPVVLLLSHQSAQTQVSTLKSLNKGRRKYWGLSCKQNELKTLPAFAQFYGLLPKPLILGFSLWNCCFVDTCMCTPDHKFSNQSQTFICTNLLSFERYLFPLCTPLLPKKEERKRKPRTSCTRMPQILPPLRRTQAPLALWLDKYALFFRNKPNLRMKQVPCCIVK